MSNQEISKKQSEGNVLSEEALRGLCNL